jgi:hypothetical protein
MRSKPLIATSRRPQLLSQVTVDLLAALPAVSCSTSVLSPLQSGKSVSLHGGLATSTVDDLDLIPPALPEISTIHARPY